MRFFCIIFIFVMNSLIGDDQVERIDFTRLCCGESIKPCKRKSCNNCAVCENQCQVDDTGLLRFTLTLSSSKNLIVDQVFAQVSTLNCEGAVVASDLLMFNIPNEMMLVNQVYELNPFQVTCLVGTDSVLEPPDCAPILGANYVISISILPKENNREDLINGTFTGRLVVEHAGFFDDDFQFDGMSTIEEKSITITPQLLSILMRNPQFSGIIFQLYYNNQLS